MKQSIIIFLLLLYFPAAIFSQVYKNTFGVNVGTHGYGYGGEITYNNNLSDKAFVQIALNTAFKSYEGGNVEIPYYDFTASYSYFLTVLNLGTKKRKTLSLGGGGLLGYELVNNGQVELSNIVKLNGKSKFIFGAVISADIDITLSEHYSLMIKNSEFYHVNTDFGNFTNYSGIGLRYYFN